MARLFGWEFTSNNDCIGTNDGHSHTEDGIRRCFGIICGRTTITVYGTGPCPGVFNDGDDFDPTGKVAAIYELFRPRGIK